MKIYQFSVAARDKVHERGSEMGVVPSALDERHDPTGARVQADVGLLPMFSTLLWFVDSSTEMFVHRKTKNGSFKARNLVVWEAPKPPKVIGFRVDAQRLGLSL